MNKKNGKLIIHEKYFEKKKKNIIAGNQIIFFQQNDQHILFKINTAVRLISSYLFIS